MKETKFYQFMSSLSPVEMNRLTKFMESPYFNKNEKLLKIYYAVESNIRDTKPTELSKIAIWDQIYPQVKYEDEKFRKHCSQLMDLAEDWLAQEVYESDRLLKSKFLLQAVFEKKLDNLFSGSTNSAKLTLSKEPLRHSNFYLHNFEIESLLYKIERHDDARVSKKNLEKINFDVISKNLDIFYISEKLKYYCSILSWKAVSNLNIDISFSEDLLNLAKSNEYNEIPSIKIYLTIFFTFVDGNNEEHFYNLKALFVKYISIFPIDEAKNIFDSALNFAIRRINQRDEKYNYETFELYQYGLENNILFINDQLSHLTFKNIVTSALLLKEFDWTEKFISEYSTKLDPKFRENAITYNTANFLFSKGNYKELLKTLQSIHYDEIFYNLHSKAWLLKAYYELDEIQVLSSFLDSFDIFLTRNKEISKIQKSIYQTQIKFTKKLINSVDKSKQELLRFKQEVEKSTFVGKPWLLEKIDEQILIAKPDTPKKKKK